MAILNFIKPDKVIMLDSSANKGIFEFRPMNLLPSPVSLLTLPT